MRVAEAGILAARHRLIPRNDLCFQGGRHDKHSGAVRERWGAERGGGPHGSAEEVVQDATVLEEIPLDAGLQGQGAPLAHPVAGDHHPHQHHPPPRRQVAARVLHRTQCFFYSHRGPSSSPDPHVAAPLLQQREHDSNPEVRLGPGCSERVAVFVGYSGTEGAGRGEATGAKGAGAGRGGRGDSTVWGTSTRSVTPPRNTRTEAQMASACHFHRLRRLRGAFSASALISSTSESDSCAPPQSLSLPPVTATPAPCLLLLQ